jgi:hypothetical protein
VSSSLPIDGGIFGAPGCFVWNDPLLLAGIATSNTGTAGLRFVVPSPTGNARAYVHWWNYDKNANAVGVTTSNYAKILLGN